MNIGTDNVGSYKDDDGSFWFPDGTTYNEGRTGTHEIGHYFNLEHPWGDAVNDSCNETDYVSDTPPTYSANYGCPPNTTNSCNATDPELGRDLRDMYEVMYETTFFACYFFLSFVCFCS